MISRRTPWIAAGLLAALLTTTFFAAQKAESPDVIYRRAVQKEKVDGDKKAAVELYKQVLAAPGASQKLKAQAQNSLNALSKSAASTGLTDRQICSDCNVDSVSPDGRIVASMYSVGPTVRDIISGQVTQIQSDCCYSAILSPDLKQIAYLGPASGQTKDYVLKIVANEAGAQPRILNSNPDYYGLIPAAWAHDGKSVLVMADKRADRTWTIAWVSTSDGTVKPLKSLGWRFQLLPGTKGLPRLSPDGRFIAYAARILDIPPNDSTSGRGSVQRPDSKDTHIYVLAADGSKPEIELVKGASINEEPVWTPDGRNLLFVSDRGGRFELWSVAMQDGALTQVRRDTGEIQTVGMTASGTYIYSRLVSGNNSSSFVIADFKESMAQRGGSLVTEPILGKLPAWSPDGKSIAFIRPTNTSPGGQMANVTPSLIVYSLDTKDEKRLVPGPGLTIPRSPLWSHDGKTLFQYLQDSKGDSSLYRVDITNGEFKQILPTVKLDIAVLYSAVLSSDDKKIYLREKGMEFTPGGCQMYPISEVDLNSGQQRHLATVSQPSYFMLSPDDKTLYMTACDREEPHTNPELPKEKVRRRIVAVNVATGQQRDVFAVQSPKALGEIALTSNGETLAAVIIDNSASMISYDLHQKEQLVRVGVDGAHYKELYMLPAGNIDTMSWTADGAAIDLETELALSVQSFMRISASGNNTEVIRSTSNNSFGGTRFSPDGYRVAIPTVNATVRELWALDNVSNFLKTAK